MLARLRRVTFTHVSDSLENVWGAIMVQLPFLTSLLILLQRYAFSLVESNA